MARSLDSLPELAREGSWRRAKKSSQRSKTCQESGERETNEFFTGVRSLGELCDQLLAAAEYILSDKLLRT